MLDCYVRALLVRRRQGNNYFHNGEPPITFLWKLYLILTHGGFPAHPSLTLCGPD
jgi:hypothetical protein